MLHCPGGVWFLVQWHSVAVQDRVGAKLWYTVASGSRHGLQSFIELRCRLAFKSNMWCQTGVSPSSVVFLFVWYGTFDCFRNHIHDAGKFSYIRFQFKWSCGSVIVSSLSSAQLIVESM